MIFNEDLCPIIPPSSELPGNDIDSDDETPDAPPIEYSLIYREEPLEPRRSEHQSKPTWNDLDNQATAYSINLNAVPTTGNRVVIVNEALSSPEKGEWRKAMDTE